MSNFQDVDVVLYRDSLSRPWGFRIQGGADFNFPLTIQRVFSGSPAEKYLLRGDIILAFDGYDVGRLTHKQAQDVVRVAGGQLKIRVRRPVFGNPRQVVSSAAVSVGSTRSKSTSPRGDPTGSYFISHEPPKPSWHPQRGPGLGDFGVQYGPKTPKANGAPRKTPVPVFMSSQKPHQEADSSLHTMQDSLTKLSMNNNQDDEVDYSFMKKPVSERKKAFLNTSNDRPRAASCQPNFRQILMSASYTEPSYSSSPPYHDNVMSSSYIEPERSAPPVHRSTSFGPSSPNKTTSLPRRGYNFGWSPSPEKLEAARRAPHVSAVSQIQQSVSIQRDDVDDTDHADQWMSNNNSSWGGFQPLLRSSSVSVLHEAPIRSAMTRNVESAAPRRLEHQSPHAIGSQFREVGRWHMETHSQPGPVKKFSTSATIRVGARGDPQPARVVRRFSASAAPFDGTMSLDRRHPEPLKITIGSSWNADYHPAYPANVAQMQSSPPQRTAAAVREIQHHISRAQAHPGAMTAPSRPAGPRGGPRAASGTYRPLQQSYSTPTRWDDPDYMSSDF